MIGCIHKTIQIVEEKGLICLFLHKRPIQKVEIVGIIVSLDRKLNKIIVYIDDGTGIIRAVKYLDQSPGAPTYLFPGNIGETIIVKGNLEMYETNSDIYGFALKINIVERIEDPNIEIYHSLMCMELYDSEYK